MVPGNMISDCAKMIGITPAMLTLSGMWLACPPYTRRPTTRLAYCTGMRRWPWVTKMTAAITATISEQDERELERRHLRRAAGRGAC